MSDALGVYIMISSTYVWVCAEHSVEMATKLQLIVEYFYCFHSQTIKIFQFIGWQRYSYSDICIYFHLLHDK